MTETRSGAVCVITNSARPAAVAAGIDQESPHITMRFVITATARFTRLTASAAAAACTLARRRRRWRAPCPPRRRCGARRAPSWRRSGHVLLRTVFPRAVYYGALWPAPGSLNTLALWVSRAPLRLQELLGDARGSRSVGLATRPFSTASRAMSWVQRSGKGARAGRVFGAWT